MRYPHSSIVCSFRYIDKSLQIRDSTNLKVRLVVPSPPRFLSEECKTWGTTQTRISMLQLHIVKYLKLSDWILKIPSLTYPRVSLISLQLRSIASKSELSNTQCNNSNSWRQRRWRLHVTGGNEKKQRWTFSSVCQCTKLLGKTFIDDLSHLPQTMISFTFLLISFLSQTRHCRRVVSCRVVSCRVESSRVETRRDETRPRPWPWPWCVCTVFVIYVGHSCQP
jgi:hypothetical protein